MPRVLLVLAILIVGPLQAQSVFACAMMDEVMHECCCVGHKTDEDFDVAVDANTDLCCERSVTISIDEEARQDTPIVKPVEVRSDVDPPVAIVAANTEFFSPPRRVALRVNFSPPDLCYSRADTYLITQRLRI
ncbi:MAG: hypothetical protein RJQ07_05265 [Pseudomonadales bacterium]